MLAQVPPNRTLLNPRPALQADPIVYVVDDHLMTLRSLEDLVGTLDIPVKTFAAADGFLKAYDASRPGCLLLDLKMPGMGGFDLLRVLRDRGIALPVIMLTGYGDVPTAVHAFKTGVAEFLEKPCEGDVLLNRVRQAVALDMRQRAERADVILAKERLSRLTKRESEVLQYVARHWMSSREIAHRLKIAEKTVDAHRAKIMEKTGSQNVAELVWLYALATNLDEYRFAPAHLAPEADNS